VRKGKVHCFDDPVRDTGRMNRGQHRRHDMFSILRVLEVTIINELYSSAKQWKAGQRLSYKRELVLMVFIKTTEKRKWLLKTLRGIWNHSIVQRTSL